MVMDTWVSSKPVYIVACVLLPSLVLPSFLSSSSLSFFLFLVYFLTLCVFLLTPLFVTRPDLDTVFLSLFNKTLMNFLTAGRKEIKVRHTLLISGCHVCLWFVVCYVFLRSLYLYSLLRSSTAGVGAYVGARSLI